MTATKRANDLVDCVNPLLASATTKGVASPIVIVVVIKTMSKAGTDLANLMVAVKPPKVRTKKGGGSR